MSFRCFVERKLGEFPHFVIYAVLEWVMIILLLVNGFLALISNEFARFFELRIPCLLCTRIDHVILCRNKNFYYNDSMCEAHKKDISSLAYCHVHKKLSDIKNMCEGCLLSFATGKDVDCDRYKSLVGILHKDVDCFVEDDQRIYARSGKKDDRVQLEKSGIDRCSCCGEPLKLRPASKFSRSPSMNANSFPQPPALAPAPSPRAPRNLELPLNRYTELKFISDNDSELPDNEDVSTRVNQRTEDTKGAIMPLLPDSEDLNEDSSKTPTFSRGNRFFGIPLSDSAHNSPRWSNRTTRKLPLDKPELVAEFTDATAINEADGDSLVNHLRRQVRLDRKSLIELYMELDEERSASAVAANNAMAMITRLQAEKAAVQMEALQYQRMMDEQAEYDQEALQVMKDLLLKREEEIRVLESDLEAYREKYGIIKRVGSEICEIDAEDDYQEIKSQSLSSTSGKSDPGSPLGADQNRENSYFSERPAGSGKGSIDESSLDFEGERSYLLGLLMDLEKHISESFDEASLSSKSDTHKPENEEKGKETKATLTREVSLIRERLRAVEAESGFLKHAAMTLQKGGEGTKLLIEIAQHLRKLRHPVKNPPEKANA